jgi:hypothetical protein
MFYNVIDYRNIKMQNATNQNAEFVFQKVSRKIQSSRDLKRPHHFRGA